MSDELDEALTRLHRTGPEFQGWLSNHGPMAADALGRLGHAEQTERWLDRYVEQLEELPAERWPIEEPEWRELLGDSARLGDWLAFFDRQVGAAPWRDVLLTWWPRLLPGAVASATHPLIRTGHAVRALLEDESAPRRAELGQALGYWAARWAPLPPTRPAGRMPAPVAMDALPSVAAIGGARDRAAALADGPAWAAAVNAAARPATAAEVPAALDAIVDAAVTRYARWGPAQPVMLVHMATAPRAAGLVLPALPEQLWQSTFDSAWATAAAIATMYRPAAAPPAPTSGSPDAETAGSQAAANGDPHAIKLTEVAVESHRRGNPAALVAARVASTYLG